MAGLNLLAAIVIYWNTARLGEAVAARETEGLPVLKEHLAHISSLGWAHILLTGEYRWNIKEPQGVISPPALSAPHKIAFIVN